MAEKLSSKIQSSRQKDSPTWILFDYYCRKQVLHKSNSTFEDIQSGLHMLHVGKFNIIIKQLNISLPRQQIISIFQSHSISHLMNYQLFEEAMNEICENDSQVREKINRCSEKIARQNKSRLEPSKYSFKITSHSGKIEKEILDELEERKRKRLSLKLDFEVKKEKEKQIMERKMGISKRNISKDESLGALSKGGNQSSVEKRTINRSSRLTSKFRSVNNSPRPAQDLYIESFLGDDEDDEYLNSLYKPRLKQKIAKRKSHLINNTRSIVDEINERENEREVRNFGTIERENNKKMEMASKVLRKYKLQY